MVSSSKSELPSPKRVIEWFYEPEESADSQWLRLMQSAWHPMVEQTPPVNMQLLVTDGKGLALGQVNGSGELVVDGVLDPATHWLPLPAPPEPVTPKGGQSIFRHKNSWRKY